MHLLQRGPIYGYPESFLSDIESNSDDEYFSDDYDCGPVFGQSKALNKRSRFEANSRALYYYKQSDSQDSVVNIKFVVPNRILCNNSNENRIISAKNEIMSESESSESSVSIDTNNSSVTTATSNSTNNNTTSDKHCKSLHWQKEEKLAQERQKQEKEETCKPKDKKQHNSGQGRCFFKKIDEKEMKSVQKMLQTSSETLATTL